tara:strand:- start:533 stop:706 length:174 start_codon:yes stop_codon:yes gene_type:complete
MKLTRVGPSNTFQLESEFDVIDIGIDFFSKNILSDYGDEYDLFWYDSLGSKYLVEEE